MPLEVYMVNTNLSELLEFTFNKKKEQWISNIFSPRLLSNHFCNSKLRPEELTKRYKIKWLFKAQTVMYNTVHIFFSFINIA